MDELHGEDGLKEFYTDSILEVWRAWSPDTAPDEVVADYSQNGNLLFRISSGDDEGYSNEVEFRIWDGDGPRGYWPSPELAVDILGLVESVRRRFGLIYYRAVVRDKTDITIFPAKGHPRSIVLRAWDSKNLPSRGEYPELSRKLWNVFRVLERVYLTSITSTLAISPRPEFTADITG